jgi:hypothetical protein
LFAKLFRGEVRVWNTGFPVVLHGTKLRGVSMYNGDEFSDGVGFHIRKLHQNSLNGHDYVSRPLDLGFFGVIIFTVGWN